MSPAERTTGRDRLAELETMLARLRAEHDVLMNAFKFDEARQLTAPIEAAERERAALAEVLRSLGRSPGPSPGPPVSAVRRRPIRHRARRR